MRRFASIFAVFVGCPVEPDCAPGFEPRDDGNCYEIAEFERPPSLMDWLDTLPACAPRPGDGRLDLDAGCADGVCLDGTRADAERDLGAATCEPYLFGVTSCRWADAGISALFRDPDLDGVTDPDDTVWVLYAHAPFTGTTTDGLGFGAETRCFVEALGEPHKVHAERTALRWRVTAVAFGPLSVYDNESVTGARASDGFVDGLSVYSTE